MDIQIQNVLVNILIALITLLGAYVVLYLNKLQVKVVTEIGKIKDDKQQKLFTDAINRLNDLVLKTVTQIEQTTAKDLREAIKNGKVDKAELLALGKQAVDEVYLQLTDDSLEVLEQELTDVEDYIRASVEATVFNIKK